LASLFASQPANQLASSHFPSSLWHTLQHRNLALLAGDSPGSAAIAPPTADGRMSAHVFHALPVVAACDERVMHTLLVDGPSALRWVVGMRPPAFSCQPCMHAARHRSGAGLALRRRKLALGTGHVRLITADGSSRTPPLCVRLAAHRVRWRGAARSARPALCRCLSKPTALWDGLKQACRVVYLTHCLTVPLLAWYRHALPTAPQPNTPLHPANCIGGGRACRGGQYTRFERAQLCERPLLASRGAPGKQGASASRRQ